MNSATNADALERAFIRNRPMVIGIAAAFVSIQGLNELIRVLRRCGMPQCRLVAGIDNAVTHPGALFAARDRGWPIRLGRSNTGIFHPKLLVGGQAFGPGGTVSGVCCVYVGSSNLTKGGLRTNVECGMVDEAADAISGASAIFGTLWEAAVPASDEQLRNYAATFAERARRRSVSQLVDLDINDSEPVLVEPNELRARRAPARGSISAQFAVAAWAGLQSFTGEYRFQIEFPRDAGIVVRQLIGARAGPGGRLDVYCPADGETRPMQYRYYEDNNMFRLNVPNETPGVEWARANRDGIAIVEQGPAGGAPLRLVVLMPGTETNDVVARSVALGTWGRTSTRVYGWF
jgi:hypothetical protein